MIEREGAPSQVPLAFDAVVRVNHPERRRIRANRHPTLRAHAILHEPSTTTIAARLP
jgi:hypothetical protein